MKTSYTPNWVIYRKCPESPYISTPIAKAGAYLRTKIQRKNFIKRVPHALCRARFDHDVFLVILRLTDIRAHYRIRYLGLGTAASCDHPEWPLKAVSVRSEGPIWRECCDLSNGGREPPLTMCRVARVTADGFVFMALG